MLKICSCTLRTQVSKVCEHGVPPGLCIDSGLSLICALDPHVVIVQNKPGSNLCPIH